MNTANDGIDSTGDDTTARQPPLSIAPHSAVSSIHVAFCGGGSGGHLSPAVAIAEAIQEHRPGSQLTFITSARAVDRCILNAAKLPEHAMAQIAVPLSGSARKLSFVLRLLPAFVTCLWQFLRRRPAVVIGTGGFASVPGVISAWVLRIPTALLELNTVPGRANRMLSRFARITFSGWAIQPSFLATWKSPIRNVGVPLRRSFSAGEQQSHRTDAAITVLVLGGSQGATGLNRIVLQAMTSGEPLPRSLRLLHQTGPADEEYMRSAYREKFSGENDDHFDGIHRSNCVVDVFSFIDDVATIMRSADIIISRAGAVTLAEIAAVNVPAILIPLQSSADDHQLANAELFREVGAAAIVEERSSNAAEQLHSSLRHFMQNDEARSAAKIASAALASGNAVDEIIAWIHELSDPAVEDLAR